MHWFLHDGNIRFKLVHGIFIFINIFESHLTHFNPVLYFKLQLVICSANQMTAFYMKYSTGLNWVKGQCFCYKIN